MLLNIVILLTIYVIVRFFENANQIAKRKNTRLRKNSHNSLKSVAINESENRQNYYLKISTISVCLAIIGYISAPVQLLSLGFLSYTSMPIFKSAEKSLLKERKFTNNVLNSLCICVAVGPYFASTLICWFYYFGNKILAKTEGYSKNMLINVFEQQPRFVCVLKDNVEIEIPLEAVQVNNIVVVNTGEVIPVDGIIIKGLAMIDQHSLTGEFQPTEKEIGDNVFASTMVVAGNIHLKVKKTGKETTISKIGDILTHSVDFKTDVQLKGEKWADKAVIPQLVLAVIAAPFIGMYSATGILKQSFGNIIRIVASLGTLSHINLAAHQGIFVKDGRAIELLNDVDTVLFDKTGTLTTEQPEVGQIIVCDNYSEKEVLIYAAATERKLTHPIAKAIFGKAEALNLNLPNVDDSKYQVGYGMTVTIENEVIQVGSVRFMKMEGIKIPQVIEKAISFAHEKGHSLIMVAINHKLIGAIEMRATVRFEVKKVISGLRQRGIKHIAIVSGDHKHPTEQLAKSLGMDSYFYEVLPENKAEIVEKLQKEGKSVCFIGDGVNDAIAMKKANVSISLKGASSIATDIAQVVLTDGSLSQLCRLFDVSKELSKNLQNTFIITILMLSFNITGIFMFNWGVIESIIINNAGFFIGVGNAMLPLRKLNDRNS